MSDAGVFDIAGSLLSVWPEGQEVATRGDPTIHLAVFQDAPVYHDALVEGILAQETDPAYAKEYFRAAGGTKVYHVEQWGFPAAMLIHARALAFFRRVLRQSDAVVDLSWANVYRAGDYALAHGHTRSTASVVYFLDAGEPDPEDEASGRFCFIDPRLACCCQEQQGIMSSPYLPPMNNGTMILFPSTLVHCVNPYNGTGRPRITLSWNINPQAVPGSPLPGQSE